MTRSETERRSDHLPLARALKDEINACEPVPHFDYWDEQEEQQRRSKEDEEKVEKEQMQMIDWHEFVVVETIEFTAEDDNIPLAGNALLTTM